MTESNDEDGFSAEQRRRADAVIEKYVLYAMGAGLIPAPLVDLAVVLGLEIRMIQELAVIYRSRFPHKLVALKLLLSLIGSVAPLYLSSRLASSTKAVPGGHAATTFLVVVNGASVYAVGKVFQRHFESGGTFLSSDNALIRRFFREKYAEGRRVAPALAASR